MLFISALGNVRRDVVRIASPRAFTRNFSGVRSRNASPGPKLRLPARLNAPPDGEFYG
jgi:hypothetical protein